MKNTTKRWAVGVACLGVSVLTAQAQGPALDPSFAIVSATGRLNPQVPAVVDMVRQPDGKFVVAGDLATVNGVPVARVCRLMPNGQVDTTFNAALADDEISSIALQTDGKLLIGGRFRNVDGQPRKGLARLQTDGGLDPFFISPFGGTPSSPGTVTKVVVQPGEGILLFGSLSPTNPAPWSTIYLARLLEATAERDTTFRPTFDTFYARDVLVQPNGHLVFAGIEHLIGGRMCNVWGTLANGVTDPGFVPMPASIYQTWGLAPDPATGKIYVAGGIAGAGLANEPVRLLPNGVPDPTFSTTGVFLPGSVVGNVTSIAVQPNGRVLLGGLIPTTTTTYLGSGRLLPSGARDPSYVASSGPNDYVRKVLVQPNGALVFAGNFTQAGGFSLNCLARMLDPNVLSARTHNRADDELAAWPVPAHDALHLRLPAARPAQYLALLDALGRVVRWQAVAEGQLAAVLPTAGLPPGGYLLRVTFASGPPAYRHVAVE